MAGYTRQDTANNISNNSIIDADDLDSEFNAVEGAFNSTTGHTHDGTVGAGAPIIKMGPGQDLVVSTTTVLPKVTATLDIGSTAAKFKDAHFSGQLNSASIVTTGVAAVGSALTVTGATVLNSNLTVAGITTLNGAVNVGVDTLSEYISDTVGAMITGNTESGIVVTYDDADNTLDFNVNDPIITITGAVTGSATMTNLGDVTITTVHAADPTLTFTGDVTGSGTMSDLGDVSIALTVQPNSVALGTDTTGNYVASLVAGTGVTLANNTGETATPTISIGQAVATTSNVTFADITATGNTILQGNLTVSGTTTTVNTETINLADNVITLNSNEAGTPSQNSGIEVERGTETNKTLVWDEAADKWTVGSETFVAGTVEANVTGNVTGNSAGTHTGAVVGNASTATTLATARTISLAGDVSGSVSFNGSADVSITATIADDSHNHVISNVDGLQTHIDTVTSSLGAVIPTGGIIIWSGSAAAIPAGWLLCDGTSSTPNLRDRFVVGAGSTYAVGATGGSADAVVVSHTHTATVTDPSHSHTFIAPNGGAGQPNSASVSYNDNTDGVSAYNNTNFIASATTGITVANSTTGVSGTNANLPPYYALCYIMKS